MEMKGGPRKILVGTAMSNMFHEYPGLEARLEELGGLIERMAAQAAEQHAGARLDIAALPEYAVNGGLSGPAEEISVPLEGPVLDVIGGRAREHSCHVVLPLMLAEDRDAGLYSNAAVLLGRRGEVVGIYRKVYAVPGPGPEVLDSPELQILRRADFAVIALANPQFAPYGKAARQALEQAGLWELLHKRFVFGDNVRQVLTYLDTGNADAALISASLLVDSNQTWKPVSPHLHGPLRQGAALLTRPRHPQAGRKFLQFLQGDDARGILRRFGYSPPPGETWP